MILPPIDVGNVHTVDFKNKSQPRPPMEKKDGECRHLFCGTLLDTDARTIECAECGSLLDPFRVLDALIRDWESIASWVTHHRKERGRLEDEVRALRVERSRLKSAIKKATP